MASRCDFRFLPSAGLAHPTLWGNNTIATGIHMEELRRMENDGNKNQVSRRGFLGVGSAALAAVAGGLAVSGGMAQEGQQAGKTDRSDPGPTNNGLGTQNPDSPWTPPPHSKRTVYTFK